VLLVLLLAGLVAALGLPFVTQAPNRLVTGHGVPLQALLQGARAALMLPALFIALAAFLRPTPRSQLMVAIAASLLMTGLLWLAGDHASRVSGGEESSARTSFGGGFWVLLVLAWLAAADALQRLRLRLAARTLAGAAVLAPLAVLAALGTLDSLSLFKEYQNRQEVFDAALWRHLEIVAATLAASLVIGVPLGLVAFRRPTRAAAMFALLNLVQTIPSIALFGLLIAPLALLSAALPWLGLRGIGFAPALIALTLYSLLPIVQSTVTGLRQVPAAVVEAANGMGMTPRQVFWRIEVPLALPLLLSGLRISTVQAVGLAVVAALIGAGGLGAIMFQGLLSSAIDLVLLGVLPVIAMAVAADAALAVLADLMRKESG